MVSLETLPDRGRPRHSTFIGVARFRPRGSSFFDVSSCRKNSRTGDWRKPVVALSADDFDEVMTGGDTETMQRRKLDRNKSYDRSSKADPHEQSLCSRRAALVLLYCQQLSREANAFTSWTTELPIVDTDELRGSFYIFSNWQNAAGTSRACSLSRQSEPLPAAAESGCEEHPAPRLQRVRPDLCAWSRQ